MYILWFLDLVAILVCPTGYLPFIGICCHKTVETVGTGNHMDLKDWSKLHRSLLVLIEETSVGYSRPSGE